MKIYVESDLEIAGLVGMKYYQSSYELCLIAPTHESMFTVEYVYDE